MTLRFASVGCLALLLLRLIPADDAAGLERIDPQGIPGSLVICGGGELPASVFERFRELAGGEAARLVVIPTASARADTAPAASWLDPWRERGFSSVELLHTRLRQQANAPELVRPLREATAVWFVGGQQSRLAEAYVGTAVEQAVEQVLARGGVVGGTSAGAAIQSRVMIAGGNPVPNISCGFDLLPDAIVDQHFRQRSRQPRLQRAVRDHPGCFGVGVDEQTALVVTGRRMEVLGEQRVTVCLGEGGGKPERMFSLRPGDVADLTALRRAARDRAGPPFPPVHPRPPVVVRGSLVLAGGGALPDAIVNAFVRLAGGPDSLIVVLPTAAPDPLPERLRHVEMFRACGARNVVALRGRTLAEVESEPFLATLRQARGLWFGGGRQWRFVDAYEGTQAERLFHEVLRRGGVIGGTSAGASIQAEYLARGDPLGNQRIMAEGYERGFGFLAGCAVDQHFTQRRRQADLERLVEAHPQLLGVGVDEQTAIVVRGAVAQVLGKHRVWFYDRRSASDDGGRRSPVVLESGERFDLLAGRPR